MPKKKRNRTSHSTVVLTVISFLASGFPSPVYICYRLINLLSVIIHFLSDCKYIMRAAGNKNAVAEIDMFNCDSSSKVEFAKFEKCYINLLNTQIHIIQQFMLHFGGDSFATTVLLVSTAHIGNMRDSMRLKLIFLFCI